MTETYSISGDAGETVVFPVIGLVGGVGSGKSTVAAEFAQSGFSVIDADKVGHELLERPDIQEKVRECWGDEVFHDDGRVNRVALGKRVFADVLELDMLEAILHPLMREKMSERIARARQDGQRGVILDAAVLFEAGWEDLCTHVVFVNTPRDQRLQRIVESRGWSVEEFQIREKRQFSLDKKRRHCCYVFDNCSNAPHLRDQVCRFLADIISE